jgi:hypothetical protein
LVACVLSHSLSAQLKAEKLMVIPSTADGFRSAVSALRSLDSTEGVSFHTFSLPEDRCVRLLVKNLGKRMPESVVREELEALDIRVQGVAQLRSGSRDQDPDKDGPPTTHIISVARGPEVSRVRSLTELCGLRVTVETYLAPKGPLQCKCCQRFGHTQRDCRHVPRCVACGGSHLSGECPVPRGQPECCNCGGDHTANYRGCVKWKEAREALVKGRLVRAQKASLRANLPPRKQSRWSPLRSRGNLVRGGATSSEGACCQSRNSSPLPTPPLPKSRRS